MVKGVLGGLLTRVWKMNLSKNSCTTVALVNEIGFAAFLIVFATLKKRQFFPIGNYFKCFFPWNKRVIKRKQSFFRDKKSTTSK